MAGLSTPLHLAASLLVLAAAISLAIAVLLGASPAGRQARVGDVWSRTLTALGALGIAVGSGLAGALVDASGEAVAWLRAAGLALIALGLSPRRLRRLAGLGAVAPFAVVPGAVLMAAVAGAVGAVRAFAGGRRTVLVGLALACWGGVGLLQRSSPAGAACLDLAGAVLLGGWIWQVSARRLLAKLATAFVAALLVVVVLLASVLSRVGASQLVADELDRLSDFARQLSLEIMAGWPGDAIRSARAVSPAGARFLELRNDDLVQLQSLYQLSFTSQDLFITLDETGRPINWYAPGEDTITASLLLAVSGSELVDRILTQTPSAGGLVMIGGRIVALGGVRLLPENPRPEDRPLGVLVTGRIVDDQWATREAVTRDIGLVVAVGGQVSAASPDLPASQLISPEEPDGQPLPEVVQVGSATFYQAAVHVLDQDSGQGVGRLYAIGTTGAVAALEEAQGRRLFLLALFAALFAACMGWVSSRRLVAPIRSLTEAAAAVREGDLSARPRIFTRDEVGELGRTFIEMTASLSTQSAQLREAAAVQARLRARLEALTASMSDALIAVDGDGRIVTFNPAAQRLVGRDVAEVSGLPLGEVLLGRGPGNVEAAEALGAPDGQEIIAAQVLLSSPQGRWIPTSVTAAPVRDASGRVLGRVFVLRDVTREAELERMKTEFLANVSHELRTPLTPIRGYAEVLARRDVGLESTRKFAEQILISTGRLERIVGMIVDFAALDSGRLVPQTEPVDVGLVVDEALAAWRARDRERAFHRRVPATLPPVAVDRAMLARCLDELLDNAVKFSPGGEPVTVTAALEPTEPAQVRVSVRDRGVGIEPDTAVRVFSDFYQVDATETRHFGGLGLGLALVRRILDSLDGDARVESEVGKGSTFHLLLPVAEGHPPKTFGRRGDGMRRMGRAPVARAGA
ncbi:MAG: ATP-binding protein [Egibacteraceae bacterium]